MVCLWGHVGAFSFPNVCELQGSWSCCKRFSIPLVMVFSVILILVILVGQIARKVLPTESAKHTSVRQE